MAESVITAENALAVWALRCALCSPGFKCDSIAATLLGFIESLVCPFHHGVCGVLCPIAGNPKTACYFTNHRKRMLRNSGTNVSGQHVGIFEIDFRTDDKELLATPSSCGIRIACHFAQDCSKFTKHTVTNRVSKGVID